MARRRPPTPGPARGHARIGASQVHVRGLALRLCDLLLDIVDHVVGQIGQRPPRLVTPMYFPDCYDIVPCS